MQHTGLLTELISMIIYKYFKLGNFTVSYWFWQCALTTHFKNKPILSAETP